MVVTETVTVSREPFAAHRDSSDVGPRKFGTAMCELDE
jgi:hypothetical protein